MLELLQDVEAQCECQLPGLLLGMRTIWLSMVSHVGRLACVGCVDCFGLEWHLLFDEQMNRFVHFQSFGERVLIVFLSSSG